MEAFPESQEAELRQFSRVQTTKGRFVTRTDSLEVKIGMVLAGPAVGLHRVGATRQQNPACFLPYPDRPSDTQCSSLAIQGVFCRGVRQMESAIAMLGQIDWH